jgi:O-acetylhomoserine/O-acetylserine sulfhydrylase-like pyridoxal-dependent enzyme
METTTGAPGRVGPGRETGRAAVAEEVRCREGAQAALLTAGGMAAIATTLVTLVSAGERIVAARGMRGDTWDLLSRDLPSLGIQVDLVDVTDADEWCAVAATRSCGSVS